jgi:tRNA threonylcarbamoyladenosine biosynthesis protein TsaE
MPSVPSVRVDDESATDALGRRLGAALRGGDVVGLEGPLGAGKTRLVRGIAAGMGIDPAVVSSPSFVLVQEYDGPGELVLAHVDAWRLDGPDAVDGLGWDELAGAPGVVTVIEWASRIEAVIPPDAAWLEIAPAGADAGDTADAADVAACDTSRVIRLRAPRDGVAGVVGVAGVAGEEGLHARLAAAMTDD